MQGKDIREKLHQGDRVYGIHVVHPGGPIGLQTVANLEVDFIFIDTEHTPLCRENVSMMCRFYKTHGVSPIVRIAYPSPILATQALDSGAEGIVVPYVETVAEVEAMVGAVKYRPLKGQKLQDVIEGTNRLRDETLAYLRNFNQHNYLIIGVESVPAYDNLDALTTVDGVDAIFIGPHDLSVSMEIPEAYSNPDFVYAVNDITQRSRDADLGVGMHFKPEVANLVQTKAYMDIGMNWVLHWHDHAMLSAKVNFDLKALRYLNNDLYEPPKPESPNKTLTI